MRSIAYSFTTFVLAATTFWAPLPAAYAKMTAGNTFCYTSGPDGPYFSIFRTSRDGTEACMSELVCGSPFVVGSGLDRHQVPLCRPEQMNVR